jgi:D-aminopeptidase
MDPQYLPQVGMTMMSDAAAAEAVRAGDRAVIVNGSNPVPRRCK